MPYEPDQYYEAQILSADPSEHNGKAFIEIYAKSTNGGINGRWWVTEKSYGAVIKAMQSYGLSDHEISNILEDASPLVSKLCKFKTELNEYTNSKGEHKRVIRAAFFVPLRDKPPAPTEATKQRGKALLSAGLIGAEAPPIMTQAEVDYSDQPDLAPIGDDDVPF